MTADRPRRHGGIENRVSRSRIRYVMDVNQDEPIAGRRSDMPFESILDPVQWHRGFVYGAVTWNEQGERRTGINELGEESPSQ